MTINNEQVKHVAKLAKLSFKEEEITQFTEKLDQMIQMVETLNQIDTTGVPVTTHVLETVNAFREDVAVEGTNRDLLFKNVPEQQDGLIKVPAIMDNGEAGA